MIHPTTLKNRIHTIDILRGVAILGIGLVNILGFNASFFDFGGYYHSLEDPEELSFYTSFIALSADKFIFIFSFLFGYGVFLQYDRFKGSESSFNTFFQRRMLYLALFGLAHIIFLWAGDILLMFAFAGMILFMLRKAPNRLIIILGTFFYFFISIWLLVSIWLPLPNALSSTCNECLNDALSIYPVGNYFQCMKLRLIEYTSFININLFYYLPKVLGVFFFGFLAGKLNLHKSIVDNYKRWFQIFCLLSVLAVLVFLYYETTIFGIMPKGSKFMNSVFMAAYEFMNLLLASAYILFILLVASNRWTQKLMMPFSYVGRMSLTNYIFQSLAFSFIFYGWGLGKFGMGNPSTFIWYAVILFIFQVLASYFWLRYRKQGPLEELWRKLSYKNLKKM